MIRIISIRQRVRAINANLSIDWKCRMLQLLTSEPIRKVQTQMNGTQINNEIKKLRNKNKRNELNTHFQQQNLLIITFNMNCALWLLLFIVRNLYKKNIYKIVFVACEDIYDIARTLSYDKIELNGAIWMCRICEMSRYKIAVSGVRQWCRNVC